MHIKKKIQHFKRSTISIIAFGLTIKSKNELASRTFRWAHFLEKFLSILPAEKYPDRRANIYRAFLGILTERGHQFDIPMQFNKNFEEWPAPCLVLSIHLPLNRLMHNYFKKIWHDYATIAGPGFSRKTSGILGKPNWRLPKLLDSNKYVLVPVQKALKNGIAVLADVDSRQHDGRKGHFIHTNLIKLGLKLNIPIILGKTILDDDGTTQLSFNRFETNGAKGTLEQFKSFFQDCEMSCQDFQLIGSDPLQ